MKKYKVCAVFIVIFIVCAFVGCQNQENNTVTEEQVLQALKEHGFEDAHIGKRIYIDANEKTYIWYYSDDTSIDFRFNNDSNSAEVLNAVMSLFDANFNEAGNYILKELLSEENSSSEEWRKTKYHDYTYRGKLDETNTYISYIWILWK